MPGARAVRVAALALDHALHVVATLEPALLSRVTVLGHLFALAVRPVRVALTLLASPRLAGTSSLARVAESHGKPWQPGERVLGDGLLRLELLAGPKGTPLRRPTRL